MNSDLKLPKNYVVLLTHLAVWMVVIGLPVLFEPVSPSSPKDIILLMSHEKRRYFGIALNLCLIVFFYLNFFLLLPRFYLSGKSRHYFLSVLLMYGLFQSVVVIFRNIAIASLPPGIKTNEIVQFSHVISTFFFLLMWGASSGFRLGEEWRRAENRRRETEKRRLEAELTLLKSQINPHFLLNSLNNLYALALTVPEKTPNAILKLSEMVAYILYECDKPKVALDHDLRFIENYITLQRLRLPPNATVQVQLPTDPVPEKVIEPMILISFIENAFKHGLTTKIPCEISIIIKLMENHLSLWVENIVLPPKLSQNGNVSGIGLSNTRQRLLHSYPERHTLSITNDHQKHIVDLQIDL
jgi:two-component system, LytTR family, sensor kinase